MKPSLKLAALLLATALTPFRAHAQAADIPSAAPVHPANETPEQRGRILLDQMVKALGGDAWLHRKDMTVRGATAAFFRGQPNGAYVEYSANYQFASDPGVQPVRPRAQRIGFITDKSMFFPGKKIDIVQVWVDKKGYEVTFKGRAPLPAAQVEEYYLRESHSIESVIRDWLRQPGVIVIAEGNTMVERRMAEKVTILSDNNDAVTLELDANTHLPLRRSFKSRNEKFKDFDEDVEEYDDYHEIQGLQTALRISRKHNGDLSNQRYYTKVEYNTGLSPELFNPDNLLKKKQ